MTWRERIAKAEETGNLATEENILLSRRLATSPVGEIFWVEELNSFDESSETAFWIAGMVFSRAVSQGDINLAKAVLAQIETIKAAQVEGKCG